MSLYLYGLIRQPEAIDFGPIGFENGAVRTIACGSFSGIIGRLHRGDFKQLPKEELIRLLLAHQKTLETIMVRHFVLPFKFGTMVKDENELLKIVHEEKDFLSELFEKVKDSVEIDVVATWDVPMILQKISEEDLEIVAYKKEMTNGVGDRAFVGMLLANALKHQADEWRQEITESLQSHAKSIAEHDLQNDQMILNTSFLIQHDKEKGFFQTLEDIDLSCKKKLHFKCVGPLPPYSFATITLQRFDPEEIQGAAKTLGLNGKAELTLVKKVYKELSRQCHPDTDPNLSVEKFEELNRAYEMIADYCKEGPRSLERKVIEKSIQLKVMGHLNHAT